MAPQPAGTSALPAQCELLVIGGGIIGAGIALEAARRGANVVLVDARDFAYGTSSRSSKLVHGGLRYLATGQLALTRESLHERGALLHSVPGLVEPQRFLMPHRRDTQPGWLKMGLGLLAYDTLAGARTRRLHTAAEVEHLMPAARHPLLRGGWSHAEAKTDDARLVLRVLHEARVHGAVLRNHCAARALMRSQGQVVGAQLVDADGHEQELRAHCVVNATGVWCDALRGEVGAAPMLRPLRGSHLLLPLARLPLACSLTWMHPRDARPVFSFPWEGMALVGTTDLDHAEPLTQEPAISAGEVGYLLEAMNDAFTGLHLGTADVVATYAGVRPVVAGGAADPSKEVRDHVVLDEAGLVSVTGGKLTTFRAIARDALRVVAKRLPRLAQAGVDDGPVFAPTPPLPAPLPLYPAQLLRLRGRHGTRAADLLAQAGTGELECVPGTAVLWAELRYSARHEWVRHLDDLLLRRTRLGLQLRHGAVHLLPRLAPMLRTELGWSESRLADETRRYQTIIDSCYALPRTLRAPGTHPQPGGEP